MLHINGILQSVLSCLAYFTRQKVLRVHAYVARVRIPSLFRAEEYPRVQMGHVVHFSSSVLDIWRGFRLSALVNNAAIAHGRTGISPSFCFRFFRVIPRSGISGS